MPQKFRVAACAGTFDHFHKGHQTFLREAFAIADTIYIGITSDAFVKSSRRANDITPFADRKKDVEVFLASQNLLARSTTFELNDIYGPTLDKSCPIEVIIVTEKTRYGAELINKLRREKGLPPLVIVETAIVEAVDSGELSSSRIRNGEIDRTGKLFIQPLWLEKDLRLPEDLRLSLQKPLGVLIPGHEDNLNEAIEAIKQQIYSRSGVITVGDVVTKSFNENGIPIDIAVVDFWVKRKEKFTSIKELGFDKNEPDVVVNNAKGTLTAAIFKAIREVFQGGTLYKVPPYIIRVVGEEDLVTLPVILAAPLNSHVFYGQPNEGIVDVLVTEEKKAEARAIVSKFSPFLLRKNVIRIL